MIQENKGEYQYGNAKDNTNSQKSRSSKGSLGAIAGNQGYYNKGSNINPN